MPLWSKNWTFTSEIMDWWSMGTMKCSAWPTCRSTAPSSAMNTRMSKFSRRANYPRDNCEFFLLNCGWKLLFRSWLCSFLKILNFWAVQKALVLGSAQKKIEAFMESSACYLIISITSVLSINYLQNKTILDIIWAPQKSPVENQIF